METKLKLFNEKTVRTVWNADEEEWYFSVVDVVEVLTSVNEINKGEDSQFTIINDSTYYVTLSPNESLGMWMVMNHFWTEERVQSYLQFLKRMEIQLPHDTIVYNGAKELNDLFWKHKKSKQEIRINIRDNYMMKLIDKLF